MLSSLIIFFAKDVKLALRRTEFAGEVWDLILFLPQNMTYRHRDRQEIHPECRFAFWKFLTALDMNRYRSKMPFSLKQAAVGGAF